MRLLEAVCSVVGILSEYPRDTGNGKEVMTFLPLFVVPIRSTYADDSAYPELIHMIVGRELFPLRRPISLEC